MNPKVNSTYLCLISKCRNVTTLKNFRPISLCNTLYKIITKIISTRIKPHLAKIISPNQASFMAKRRASNNVIIVQEYVKYLFKMRGKQPTMILKIDFEKTFESIEWSFIRQALSFFNFPQKLSQLILSYISTFSISILVNRAKLPISTLLEALNKVILCHIISSSFV